MIGAGVVVVGEGEERGGVVLAEGVDHVCYAGYVVIGGTYETAN